MWVQRLGLMFSTVYWPSPAQHLYQLYSFIELNLKSKKNFRLAHKLFEISKRPQECQQQNSLANLDSLSHYL